MIGLIHTHHLYFFLPECNRYHNDESIVYVFLMYYKYLSTSSPGCVKCYLHLQGKEAVLHIELQRVHLLKVPTTWPAITLLVSVHKGDAFLEHCNASLSVSVPDAFCEHC